METRLLSEASRRLAVSAASAIGGVAALGGFVGVVVLLFVLVV
jgi:hypothetical protein